MSRGNAESHPAESPGLAKFAAAAFGQPGELMVWGANAGSPHNQSHTGVHQCNPCGLTLKGPLEQVQQMHPHVRLIAYADDTYLQGSQEDMIAAFATLKALSSDIGLQVQERKCEASGGDSAAAKTVVEHLGIHFVPSEEGIMVAGIPIGSEAFAKQLADSIAAKTCDLIDTLLEVPTSAQKQFLQLCKLLQLYTAHATNDQQTGGVRKW